MKIMTRLGLLIRADAHGVMDQLEERSLLIKQHLREAELELARKRARLEAHEEETRRLEEEASRIEQRLEALDADVDLALERGEEDLARYAVGRLLPERAALRDLRDRLSSLGDSRERLGARLRDQETSFDDLRARAKARLAVLEQEEDAGRTVDRPVADEEIEFELLRRQGTLSGEEAR